MTILHNIQILRDLTEHQAEVPAKVAFSQITEGAVLAHMDQQSAEGFNARMTLAGIGRSFNVIAIQATETC